MDMYKEVGEFTPDSLIASPDFPLMTEGIELKAGQGVLKRGSLICLADGYGVLAGSSSGSTDTGSTDSTEEGDSEDAAATTSASAGSTDETVYGILANHHVKTGDDEDGDAVVAAVYVSGVFNRAAVILADGADLSDYELEMRKMNMYLRNVQEYGN